MKVTLDTSVLITMNHYYPRDVFVSVWRNLEAAIAAGDCCICDDVLRELKRGDDHLHDWARAQSSVPCARSQDEITLVVEISTRFPDWVRETKNAADPFIIAHAQAAKRDVVTAEKPAGPNTLIRNQKIPTVASQFGVDAHSILEWMRLSSWTF